MSKDTDLIVSIIVIVAVLLLLCFVLSLILYPVFNTEYVVVEGNVVETKTFLKDNGDLDYIEITFDNGEMYKTQLETGRYSDAMFDFTKSSKLIVKLYKTHYLFFTPEHSRFWKLDTVMKVPE